MRLLKPILLAALGGVLAYAVALEVVAAPRRPPTPPGTVLVSFAQLGETRLPQDAVRAHPGDYLAGVPRAIRLLDGHQVAIQGFAVGTGSGRPGEASFLLVRSQATCCFGIPPTLADVVEVRCAGPSAPPPQDRVVTVVGRLRVRESWAGPAPASLFQLDAARAALDMHLGALDPTRAPGVSGRE